MRLRLEQLELTCKKSVERIHFTEFNYFYGEMGAGKSTIARLVDYCLGSKQLVMTPALQSEFVSVALELQIGETALRLDRERESGQLVVTWEDQQLVIPARVASGPVIPDTEVEVLSDLIFHLNGLKPPRVRRSQLKDDSDLERLSLRDLLWYCYLDQDSMDSSFFNLDRESDFPRRLKSRNVLRSILGIHQERVAELELLLEELRQKRQRSAEGARVLAESLEEEGVSTEAEITGQITELQNAEQNADKRIKAIRSQNEALQGHAADRLRKKARQISSELQALESTVGQVVETMADDQRHLNEILALSTKVRRLESARAVLNGVEFQRCPRCTQELPNREGDDCHLCGQAEHHTGEDEATEGEATQADMDGRLKELREMLEAQATQLKRLRYREKELRDMKNAVDEELTEAMREYDSAYLAEALAVEKEKASLNQEQKYLRKLKALPSRVEALKSQADQLAGQESQVRRELKEAREAAEQDLTNLRKLEKLFLDCLLRAKIAGFYEDDIVRMLPPWFLPEIVGSESGELATISFGTLGSGGKKNLFKCCFALAVHRLARVRQSCY